MALNRTQLEITVKTVGQQAIQSLNKELGLTRAEAKRAIAEFAGFEKAKDTLEDFTDVVLDTEKGINRYIKFLEKQRAELKFNGDEYRQLTAEILNYQNQLKQAQSAALVTPLSSADLRTEQGIQQQIQQLRQQASTLDMTSEAYRKLKEEIRGYQRILKEADAEPKPTPEPLNPRSLAGLRQSIQDLERLRENVDAGSQQFYELGKQIEFAKRNLEQYVQTGAKSGVINGVAPVTEQGIKNEIDYLTQVRSQLRLNSEEYNRYTAEIRKYQKQIQEAQNPKEVFADNTLRGLRDRIDTRQLGLQKLDFNSPEFEAEKRAIEELNNLYAERTRVRLQPASAAELQTVQGIRKQIEYLQQEQSELAFVDKKWGEIAREIDRLNKTLQEAGEAALRVKPLPTSERGIRGQIEALQAQRAELDITSNKYRELSRQIREYDRELQRAQEGAGTFGGRFGGRLLGAAGAVGATSLFGGGIISGLGAGVGYLAGGQAGAFAAAGIAQSIQMTVMPATELAAQVSRLNRVLAEESGAQYGKNLEFIRKIAVSTGQTLPEATQSFLKLNASIKAAGGDTETARGVYEAIAGAVVKFGGSTEEVNGALLATTQVFSKGKVQAEELSGQIGERLVGAYAKFAKANGFTTKELSKFLQEGEVTLDQFLKFAQFIQKEGVQALDNYATSAEGAGARFNAAFSQFQIKVGTALQPAGAALQDFGVKALEVAGDAIVKLVDGGKALGTAFASIPKPVIDAAVAFVTFTTAFKALSAAISLGQVAIPAIIAGITTLSATIASLGGPLSAATLAAETFWVAVTGPVGAAALAVAALASISVALYQNNKDFRDWVDALGQIISSDFSSAMQKLKELASGAAGFVSDKLDQAGKIIAERFGGLPQLIGEKLGQVTGELNKWFNSLPPWLRQGLSAGFVGVTAGPGAGVGSLFAQSLADRVQQRVQVNRLNQTAADIFGNRNTLGGLFPLGTPSSLTSTGNRIQNNLPGQGNDSGKDDKKKKDNQKALQDQLLRDQAEAFRNQQALDKQLLENRQGAERRVYEQKLELLKLSNERELIGLNGLAAQVAQFFQGIKERRKRDELELFQLQQRYQDQLFESQQKRASETFKTQQEAVKLASKMDSGSGKGAGFSTFSGIAKDLGLIVTSGYRPGDRGFHGTDQARDYAGTPNSMMEFAKTMAQQFGGQLKELIYTPLGFGIKNGRQVPLSFWGDKTNAEHFNHVHVAFTGEDMAPVGSARNNIMKMARNIKNPGEDAASAAAANATKTEIESIKKFQNAREAQQYILDFDRITQGVKDSAAALDDEASKLKQRAELIQRGFSPEDADRIAEQQTRLNKLSKEGEKALEEFDKRAKDSGLSLEEQKRLRKELADAIDGQKTSLLELFRVQEQGKENNNTFANGAKEALKTYADAALNYSEGAKQAITGIFSKTEDALVEFVTTGKANFTDFVNSIISDLARLAIRQAILGPIAKALGGGGGFGTTSFGLFDVLGGVLNGTGGLFANGGIMTPDGPLPLNRYASGGIATSPQVALFGEGRTPEAFVPLPDGRRIPVAMQGGPQGGTTNVVVNVDAKGSQVQGDKPSGAALGKVISQAVQAEIARQKRPGGLLFAGA